MKVRFPIKPAVLFGTILFYFSSTTIAKERLPDKFTAKEIDMGEWHLRAITSIDWPKDAKRNSTSLPIIKRLSCHGESPDISFTVGETGRLENLDFHFTTDPDGDGDKEQITLLGDRIWIFADKSRWEFANIPMDGSGFKNLTYPQPDPNKIIIPVWFGHQAVRQSANEPWIDVSRIYGELIEAKKLEWSFKSRNWQDVDISVVDNRLPEGWEKRRYPIENTKLKEAIAWCDAALQAKNMRSLPSEFRKYLSQ